MNTVTVTRSIAAPPEAVREGLQDVVAFIEAAGFGLDNGAGIPGPLAAVRACVPAAAVLAVLLLVDAALSASDLRERFTEEPPPYWGARVIPVRPLWHFVTQLTPRETREPSATSTAEVVASVDELVGETPLLRLDALADGLLGKVEAANPYSVKDRIARAIVDAAEASSALPPGGTVVEATSGNTGIGLAAVAAARGYDCVLTMPASMSEERRRLLRALGADLELTPAEEGMSGATRRAERIYDQRGDAVLARQFANAANPLAHRQTTGPEIARATDGGVDAVVAGVGTGGTITGTVQYLREERDLDVTAVGVEPAASPTLSRRSDSGHDIQGIGPGFLPKTLDEGLVDEVRAVTDERAKTVARRLAREEGLLVGVSAGAAAAAGIDYAADNPDETVVAVLPDGGERYLSTDLFDTA